MRDIPVNHRFERAYPLGTGYDLNDLKTSGVYDVTDPVNGPDAGSFFVEVIVNAAQSVTDTTVLYRLTDKASGAVWIRLYDETDGFGSWLSGNTGRSVDERTSGADPITLLAGIARHNITTGGTAGGETVTLPNGTIYGERTTVFLKTLTNGSDVVNVALSNLAAESIYGGTAEDTTVVTMALDAANEYVTFEWTGLKWNILYTNGTVALT